MAKRQAFGDFTHFTYQDEVLNPYRMVFVTLNADQHRTASSVIRALEKTSIANRRGQGSFHTSKESDAVRKRLIKEVSSLDISAAVVIDVKPGCSNNEARSRCFKAYIEWLATTAEAPHRYKLVLDRNDSGRIRDEGMLCNLRQQWGVKLHFEHVAGKKHSLTVLPDLIAWCFAHSGKARNAKVSWRTQIQEAMNIEVIKV